MVARSHGRGRGGTGSIPRASRSIKSSVSIITYRRPALGAMPPSPGVSPPSTRRHSDPRSPLLLSTTAPATSTGRSPAADRLGVPELRAATFGRRQRFPDQDSWESAERLRQGPRRLLRGQRFGYIAVRRRQAGFAESRVTTA